jgi:pimeloyl-ACP methyl ester carboxylesterase
MFVTSRGYRIRYQVFGAGPVVVLLHGRPMWGGRWIDAGYVDRLRDRFRVIVPDLLGHGGSDKPHDPSAYGTPNIAADALAILGAEGVNAAHLWGYSWGSIIAEYLPCHLETVPGNHIAAFRQADNILPAAVAHLTAAAADRPGQPSYRPRHSARASTSPSTRSAPPSSSRQPAMASS